MKKKILVFTGAGVSAESGVETFRDTNGLWCNHKIEDVATPDGWKKDKETVLEFYNQRRKQLKTVFPNKAHEIIAELENNFDVTVVTQNVDNLHERAGSTNVVHLHGELTKVRSTLNPRLIYDWEDDLNIGDKCEKGSQLRPHIVWFSEVLSTKDTEKAYIAAEEADACIVVGTSMQVSPANTIPFITKEDALLYYVDPGKEIEVPTFRKVFYRHFQEGASGGMEKVKNDLIDLLINNKKDIRTQKTF